MATIDRPRSALDQLPVHRLPRLEFLTYTDSCISAARLRARSSSSPAAVHAFCLPANQCARSACRRCTAWACTRCPGSRRASCRASCRGSSSWAAWCSGALPARQGPIGGRQAPEAAMRGSGPVAMLHGSRAGAVLGAQRGRVMTVTDSCAGLPVQCSFGHELRTWPRMRVWLPVYSTEARQCPHWWPAEAAQAQANPPNWHHAVPSRQACATCHAGAMLRAARRRWPPRAQARAALADAARPGHAARRLRAPGRDRAAGHALGGRRHFALVRFCAARQRRVHAISTLLIVCLAGS